MTDYQRRVRLTLTDAEARVIDLAIAATEADIENGWRYSAAEVAALGRAWDKLRDARDVAARRNAEKAATKAAEES